MKYSCEIEINLPREKVNSLFDNPDNIYKWMHGLQSAKLISGNAGEAGAKTEMFFKTSKREITMVETITIKNLPDEFTATYEAKGVFNIVKNIFEVIDENTTKYITEQEFQFKGFMNLVAFLMPGVFKKESMKYLNDFKKFAEGK